ncbi:MAG TPA: arginase family protein [Solirubrobacteraceae bacterium]|nr:arginase family protein [Solirubrobacteraceae bacterium]
MTGEVRDPATVAVIGVPTSAGAFAPGQEDAPRALREAGLLDVLRSGGMAVEDRGDLPRWRWRPDRARPRAQNLGRVVEIVRETAAAVAAAAGSGAATLVLGGDCTVGIGTVAGHAAARGADSLGVVYLDAHADCNIPSSVPEGALDWMGMAHMLGEDGAEPALVAAGPRTPLLGAGQVVLCGWDPVQATAFEREVIERRALRVVTAGEVARDPAAAALRARGLLEPGASRLLVHFDVDVIDFTDVPLSENPGRNEGLAYDGVMRALEVLVASPCFAGLTITELNPAHVEEGSQALERFAAAVAGALAGTGA